MELHIFMAKAKLIITIDNEQYEEIDIDLIDGGFDKPNQGLRDYWLQSRFTVNEKLIRQAVARSINNAPLKYATGKCWEAVLTVPSRMNEISFVF